MAALGMLLLLGALACFCRAVWLASIETIDPTDRWVMWLHYTWIVGLAGIICMVLD